MEVVLAEERRNDVALILACHLVAVDQFLACVPSTDVRIIQEISGLDLHFGLVANDLEERTLASVKSEVPDATPPKASRMRSAEPTI